MNKNPPFSYRLGRNDSTAVDTADRILVPGRACPRVAVGIAEVQRCRNLCENYEPTTRL